MAIQSVATEPEAVEAREAFTSLASDYEWEQLGSSLRMGVWRRLAASDRGLYAATRIAEMLQADRLGEYDKENTPGVGFNGFSPVDREALEIGMIELLRTAQESLDEVRENRHCCVTGADHGHR